MKTGSSVSCLFALVNAIVILISPCLMATCKEICSVCITWLLCFYFVCLKCQSKVGVEYKEGVTAFILVLKYFRHLFIVSCTTAQD